MTKCQKTIMALVVAFSLIFSCDGECSEFAHISRKGRMDFAPRYMLNVGVTMLLSTGFAVSDDKITTAEVAALFLANSVTPVILFQNYHLAAPFLATIAFTGATFAVTEFIVKQIGGGYETVWRAASWWVAMPLIASKINHLIYLKRYKKRQLELNLLQPTYLSYNNKMVPGVRLIEVKW